MKTATSKVIAVDFDGTLVVHDYPRIGEEVPGAVRVLQRLTHAGHRLILYTMRSDNRLLEACEWCRVRGVELWGINENPEQHHWTNSPKIYAHLYIDDAALGAPLRHTSKGFRPHVDWESVETLLQMEEYLERAK
jgi:hydroxymethylpyrimidine pyrophosphatase-like HAD family hydrolase